ncbi:hypothetical protein MYSTI_07323 [Myxococcus stipitatus DSM 14675]|uniref:Uncharacterized protein n=1 Tax=Myxococcus stipitatus (strain DSM 14675 / JCM 12634 / Mx s8) TaxID=1278073 RepID=L7UL21_MYXSD|nr:hypothetical protein [Myxococcus stipitatus]AGC48595.1 hypothetical protein MYSTI_07323 [Myxococcus stipitatus DSM 14675]
MLYGDSKSREMARSLLPSTRRKKVRFARTVVNRNTRRASRTRIAQLLRDPELADDCAELDEDSTSDMRGVVWYRRQADKVNPFIRWARWRTQDQPRELRVGLMRGALPAGVIGSHALSHLRGDKHFMTATELAWRTAWRASLRRSAMYERGLLAQLLRALLLLPNGQKSFNTYLKQSCAESWSRELGRDGEEHVVLHGSGDLRLLLGTHDVLSFLDDLGTHDKTLRSWSSDRYASTRYPALKFLDTFHRLDRDLVATVAALPVRSLASLPFIAKHGTLKHSKASPGESK